MLNKKIYCVLGENKDLGNKLHAHYIYDCDNATQAKIKLKIDDILREYSDKKLLGLAYDKNTRSLIQEFISLKKEPNWLKILNKILRGLKDLLNREIKMAEPILKPKSIISDMRKQLKKMSFYHKTDIIKIKEEKKGIIKINYLSTRFSPKYDSSKLSYYGLFEPWRDTQLIFTLNFNKNLFIWDYINVEESFQGKRIGTRGVLFVEELATKLGFKRFSVEYPNRAYWIKKLNYNIPYKYRIGSESFYPYTLEGYKEI
jgi:GNAT superfamily N-acetyltransferase